MSILLTGVEMPEKKGLWVVIHPDGTVEYNTGDEGWKTLKRSAAHVQPHGDLIDRNDIKDRVSWCSSVRHALVECDRAPAIIPATEEVYNKYTDTAGNLHWTGTKSGTHIIPEGEGET